MSHRSVVRGRQILELRTVIKTDRISFGLSIFFHLFSSFGGRSVSEDLIIFLLSCNIKWILLGIFFHYLFKWKRSVQKSQNIKARQTKYSLPLVSLLFVSFFVPADSINRRDNKKLLETRSL